MNKHSKLGTKDTLKLKINFILTGLTLLFLITSCSKVIPLGFWTNYHSDLITSKENDQGPWGGRTEIHWKSNDENSFSTKEILEFAKKNGWQLIDSLVYKKNVIKPLSNYSKKDYSYRLLENFLNKFKSSEKYIFVFKTDLIAVEPGNEKETSKNGFVFINSDQKELAVYHLWGE